MKRVILITLASALLLAGFAAEGFSGILPPGEGYPITASGYSNEANGGETPTGTQQPKSEDAVSMNALVGLWHTSGYIENYYWAFGIDGSFAYYIRAFEVTFSVSPPKTPYKSENYYKGSYRVNGNAVEFYNIQNDSYFEYNRNKFKYFDDAGDLTVDKLLNTSLQNALGVDNFSFLFEFKNASRLRIAIDRGKTSVNYDSLFNYIGARGNVRIPTHIIPGSAWPKDELPPDLPPYTTGRVRDTRTTSQYHLNVRIIESTRENFIAYVELLLKSGWRWKDEDNLYEQSQAAEFDAFKRGEEFKVGFTFINGSYEISSSYNVNETGQAEVIWWK